MLMGGTFGNMRRPYHMHAVAEERRAAGGELQSTPSTPGRRTGSGTHTHHMGAHDGQAGGAMHFHSYLSIIQRDPHHRATDELRFVLIPRFNAQVVDLWTRGGGILIIPIQWFEAQV